MRFKQKGPECPEALLASSSTIVKQTRAVVKRSKLRSDHRVANLLTSLLSVLKQTVYRYLAPARRHYRRLLGALQNTR